MPTEDGSFELGLLPVKKWNWRTFATSYGLLGGLILFLVLFGFIFPDELLLNSNYHVTELVPRPPLRPEKQLKLRTKTLRAKLLPKDPVFRAPKLVCTSRSRRKSNHPK